MNGVIPHGLNVDILETDTSPTPATEEAKGRTLTQAEFMAMDSDELKSGLATGKYLIGS